LRADRLSAESSSSSDRRHGMLLHTQMSLRRLHDALQDPSLLNMSYALLLDGNLCVPSLQLALNALLQRHEPLRTAYLLRSGEAVACVHDLCSLPVSRVPLASTASESREFDIAQVFLAEAGGPFELDSPPLLRASLLELDTGTRVLLLTFHHIVADGWSLDIFSRECSLLYSASLRGVPSGLPDLRKQCIDEAEAQALWLRGPEAESDRRWWRGYLSSTTAPVANTENGSEKTKSNGVKLGRLVLRLPPEVIGALAKAQSRGATLFMQLLAAFAASLALFRDTRELLIATLLANRHSFASTYMMGAHYDAVLLRMCVETSMSLEELTQQASAAVLEALRHRLPFSEIAESAASGQTITPSPMLLLDNYPLHRLHLDGVQVTPLFLTRATPSPDSTACIPWRDQILSPAACDLTFFVREDHGSHALTVFWNEERISNPDDLALSFVEALRLLANRPSARVSDVPLSRHGERHDCRSNSIDPNVCVPACLAMPGAFPVEAISPIPTGVVPPARA